MFAAMNNPISAYQKTDIELGVESANPHKLILMLFEGAQLALAKTKMHIQKNEIADKGEMLSKAIMIIDHGLKASLDTNVGGEMALQLQALYDYMINRLLVANLQNDLDIINEVNGLLSELHHAWQAIGESDEAKQTVNITAI